LSTLAAAAFLVGRVLFAAMFASSARGHILNAERYLAAARRVRLPLPEVAGWPIGLWLIVGDLSIVLGIWPDIGALMLALFLVPTTLLFHPFWNFSDPTERRTQTSSFVRNVSLLGGCLIIFAACLTIGHALRFTITGPALSF
jgi:putative oxidoreductase